MCNVHRACHDDGARHASCMPSNQEPLRAGAGHTKQGMAERLAVAEDRLARVMREDVMRSLAEAKLQLAQADYDILELQVPFQAL